jgi:glycosyltransferase involved in cell wall biosynthesis
MPIFPGAVIRENVPSEVQVQILSKFELSTNQFFLYPAQFWPHKNHTLLINAIQKVIETNPTINLVFTGSNKGNLSYIENYIKERNLSNHIKIMGFVSNEELFTLYKNAISLVMPTFLGPSNMPPLEAAFLDCPVLISDLEGHRELMKTYATYFDPTNVDDLTTKLLSCINKEKSNEKFDTSGFNIENAITALEASLLKIIPIRSTWGH